MQSKSSIQEGLEIFSSAWGRYTILAEDGRIIPYAEKFDGTTDEKYIEEMDRIFSDEAVTKLKSLGWSFCESGWSHYAF